MRSIASWVRLLTQYRGVRTERGGGRCRARGVIAQHARSIRTRAALAGRADRLRGGLFEVAVRMASGAAAGMFAARTTTWPAVIVKL